MQWKLFPHGCAHARRAHIACKMFLLASPVRARDELLHKHMHGHVYSHYVCVV